MDEQWGDVTAGTQTTAARAVKVAGVVKPGAGAAATNPGPPDPRDAPNVAVAKAGASSGGAGGLGAGAIIAVAGAAALVLAALSAVAYKLCQRARGNQQVLEQLDAHRRASTAMTINAVYAHSPTPSGTNVLVRASSTNTRDVDTDGYAVGGLALQGVGGRGAPHADTTYSVPMDTDTAAAGYDGNLTAATPVYVNALAPSSCVVEP